MKRALLGLAGALMSLTLGVSAHAADTIKIGVAGAHSGDLASYGVPSLNAAKIIADKVNKAGGINGKMIELVIGDDQCKPELATNVATKLISDKAAVVMGHICSGATKASLALYNEAHILSISPSATTPGLTDGSNPMFLRTIAKDDSQAKVTSEFMLKELKVKKVAYLHDNGDYGKGFADMNRANMEKAGVETVLFEAITPDAVDFSSIVKKLRHAKADILVFGGYQPTASKLLQQMRRAKVMTPVIGPDGLKDEAFIKMAGKEVAEGVYCSYPKDTSSLPLYKEATQDHLNTFKTEPGSFYYFAYSAMLCIVNAIKEAGSTDTDKMLEVLHTKHVDTPIGSLVFNKSGDAAGLGMSIYVIKDGKFQETNYSITID